MNDSCCPCDRLPICSSVAQMLFTQACQDGLHGHSDNLLAILHLRLSGSSSLQTEVLHTEERILSAGESSPCKGAPELVMQEA